jgi:hypothetical protein
VRNRRLLAAAVACAGIAGTPAPAIAATFTVTSAEETLPGASCAPASPTCTLPQAIADANADGTLDDIRFALDFLVSREIHLTAPLEITSPVRVDASTQPGYDPANPFTRVLLLGLPSGSPDALLRFRPGSSGEVRGFAMGGSASPGIDVMAGAGPVTIAANMIGISPGPDPDDEIRPGVTLAGDGSTVGGTQPADRNVLPSGVLVAEGAENSTVVGNHMGVDWSGAGRIASPNASAVQVDCDADRTTITGNRMALQFGVQTPNICATGTTDDLVVSGNVIGYAPADPGTGPLTGIYLSEVTAPRVTGNAIGGHEARGIIINRTTDGLVENNRVGTQPDGAGAVPNQTSGVLVTDSTRTTIAGNTIASTSRSASPLDAGAGVEVGYGANGIRISRNTIRANGGLGIDLVGFSVAFELPGMGPTANDPADADEMGAGGFLLGNRYQNFPEITAATTDGARTATSLRLHSRPSTDYTVELFSSPACDASGYGEGETYLATATLRTDPAGNAQGAVDLPALPPGTALTATATDDATGDTSELSACRAVATQEPTPEPTPAPTTQPPPEPTPTPVPPPVLGQSVVVAPVSGSVLVRERGQRDFVALRAGDNIRMGSTVDATKGRVKLTAVDAQGRQYSGEFYGGQFLVRQAGGYTELVLNAPLAACPKRPRAAAKPKPKRKRYVWGDSTGRFRTRGNYGTAANIGTVWLTTDSCAGTEVRVVRGVVRVRDLTLRKNVIVRGGKRYLARPNRR